MENFSLLNLNEVASYWPHYRIMHVEAEISKNLLKSTIKYICTTSTK